MVGIIWSFKALLNSKQYISKYVGLEIGVVFAALFTNTAMEHGLPLIAPNGYLSLILRYGLGITLWSGMPLANNVLNASCAVWEPQLHI